MSALPHGILRGNPGNDDDARDRIIIRPVAPHLLGKLIRLRTRERQLIKRLRVALDRRTLGSDKRVVRRAQAVTVFCARLTDVRSKIDELNNR